MMLLLTVLFSFYAQLDVVIILYPLGPVVHVLTLDVGLQKKHKSYTGRRDKRVFMFLSCHTGEVTSLVTFQQLKFLFSVLSFFPSHNC